MSDHSGASDAPPNHLGTQVPSGDFEKQQQQQQHDAQQQQPAEHSEKKAAPPAEDEEEDEDMDALIAELESDDGHMDEEDDEGDEPGSSRPVPEELLNTDTRMGLTDAEVTARRKKYGLNQMKEEKENMILKFCMFFVGPIQFVMEVSSSLFSLGYSPCYCLFFVAMFEKKKKIQRFASLPFLFHFYQVSFFFH